MKYIYCSSPEIFKTACQMIPEYDLKKSIIVEVPVDKGFDAEGEYIFRQDEVISDAYYFNESGVPVFSMVCGEQYLFHTSDRPDRIPVEELAPVGMVFAEMAYMIMDSNK